MSGDPTGKEFMGRGWAYPFRIEPATGRVATVADEEDIKQSIRIILGTAKGERVMRPDFGCGIHQLVFQAVDTELIARVKRDVSEALRTYEPRIELVAVEVHNEASMRGLLRVEIEYRVRQTNQTGNLVFPFYFKEGR